MSKVEYLFYTYTLLLYSHVRIIFSLLQKEIFSYFFEMFHYK